jgi:fluoride exporter
VNLLAVFVGGLVGTALRLGIDALLPHNDDGFPWSTLIVNVIGSFALGLLVSRIWRTAPEWLRYGLGTGLLGSFTTFSALTSSYFLLTYVNGPVMVGLIYLFATLVAGWGAAFAGLGLGRRGANPPPIGPDE